MNGKSKKRNVVSTVISDEAQEKLLYICQRLDRSKSWIISRLILEADAEKLAKNFGDND